MYLANFEKKLWRWKICLLRPENKPTSWIQVIMIDSSPLQYLALVLAMDASDANAAQVQHEA